MQGTRIGQYELQRVLGRGAFGEVWLAQDHRLGRQVAIKQLKAQVLGDPDVLRRFDSEAEYLLKINEPHVVRVLDRIEIEGAPALVTEYMEGGSLSDLKRTSDGPFATEDIMRWCEQAALGLSAIHGRGILHRDIKPANLFLSQDGNLSLGDFGLARSVDMTQTMGLQGTMPYMSPEQIGGLELDARSDLFALGVSIYELLTGIRPFGDGLDRTAQIPSARSIRAEVPALLSDTVDALLVVDVDNRVQSAEELKSFDAIDWYARRQKKRLEEVAVSDIHQTVTIEKVNFVNLLPSHVMQGLLIAAALLIAIGAGANTPQVGALVTLLIIVPQLMRPLQGASALLMTLQKSWPNIARVFGMLQRESEEEGDEDPVPVPPANEPAAVTVRDLVFHYEADGPAILDGASFDLQPGKVTGLVARMGAGKTTFFRLLMRFFRPGSGTIAIDEKPLDDFPLRQLRREVTMMAQFPTFSPDTIRDNLLLAAPAATDDELVQACELTGIWAVLQRNFGENLSASELLDRPFASGNELSGGQRKLFALSRCLLRHPRLLLLDEPTTGIDNIEKFALLERLRHACDGRTVLVIDHDVRWLSGFCDEILVLEDGRITARGTPDELLQDQSLFRELHEQGESEMPRG